MTATARPTHRWRAPSATRSRSGNGSATPTGAASTDENARRLLLSPSDKGVRVPGDVTAGPADKASFEIALHEVVRDAGDERERLYVYFAGHGFSVDDDFTVQGALAFADFDRNRTDNSIVVTELLSELSFTGFTEQILVFDACRNIPFEGRLRAGRISRPIRSGTGRDAAVLRAGHDRAQPHVRRGRAPRRRRSRRASCTRSPVKARRRSGTRTANEYVVRWDQMFEYVTASLRSTRR